MADALVAFGPYFALFKDFRGFTDFFLLQDLVTDDYAAVKFFMSFDVAVNHLIVHPHLGVY